MPRVETLDAKSESLFYKARDRLRLRLAGVTGNDDVLQGRHIPAKIHGKVFSGTVTSGKTLRPIWRTLRTTRESHNPTTKDTRDEMTGAGGGDRTRTAKAEGFLSPCVYLFLPRPLGLFLRWYDRFTSIRCGHLTEQKWARDLMWAAPFFIGDVSGEHQAESFAASGDMGLGSGGVQFDLGAVTMRASRSLTLMN